MIWRYIIAAIMTATIITLQSIQLNISVEFAYIFGKTKSYDLSILSSNQSDGAVKSYLTTYSIAQITYFLPLIVSFFGSLAFFWQNNCRLRASHLMLAFLMLILNTLAFLNFTILNSVWLKRGIRFSQAMISPWAYSLIFDYLSIWIPPKERGAVCGFVYGSMASAVALSSWFSDLVYQWPVWTRIFIIVILIAVVTFPILFTASTPQLHPFISEEETKYISDEFEGRADKDTQRPPIKLRNLFSCKPFLAGLLAFSCFFWGWFVVLYILPIYLEQIHGINVLANINFAVLPFLCTWLVSITFGIILDILTVQEFITATVARKICILTSCLIQFVCFLMLNAVGKTLAICLIWILILAMGAGLTGIFSSLMDIAPNFGFIVMLVAHSTLFLIYIPILLIVLFIDFKSLWSYWLIFGGTSGLFAIEAIICVLFLSSDEAFWNRPEEE